MVSNLEEPRPQKLALDTLSERPHCMAVIEPRHTLSGCVEVGALLRLEQRRSGPLLRLFLSEQICFGSNVPNWMRVPCAALCQGCIFTSSSKHSDPWPLLVV